MACGRYVSPLGVLELTADEEGLTGLWFEGRRRGAPVEAAAMRLASEEVRAADERARAHIEDVKRWLDAYFSGVEPDFMPRVHLCGTAFQLEVWEELRAIPYGRTVSYGDIARAIARRRGIARMAAQAVGGAVGRNPVSIIVPCHRVIGADGSITGYGGGIDRKRALLALEGIVL